MKKFSLQNPSFSPIPEKNQPVFAQDLSNSTKNDNASPLTSELLSRLFSAVNPQNKQETEHDASLPKGDVPPTSAPLDNRIYEIMRRHDALSKKIDERLSKRP